MKKVLLAAFVALLLIFPALAKPAAATTFNPSYTLNLGDGFSYTESTFTDGGKNQAMYLGEYKPSAESKCEFVIHSIRNGSKTTLTNVLDIAKDYEKTTGRKVLYATNGDYFDFTAGNNMDSYVNDGVVISKGAHATKHCMGFDNNGKVVVGRLTEAQKRLLVEVDGKKYLFEIDKVNAEPAEGEIAVYNKTGKHSVKGAGKYIITTDSVNLDQYPVWGESRRTVTGEVIDDKDFTLKSGQFAIVVKGEEKAQFFFDNVVYGVKCSLVEIPDGEFKDCNWVIGGYDILVDNGVVNTNPHTDNDGSGNAPRTFMGFKEDGTAILAVVDGRQSHSAGISVKREAEIAKELGLKNALELDGGGSSTVILRVDDELTLRNKPSDGNMRKVSNAVLLVEKTDEGATDPEPPENPDNPPTGDNTGDKPEVLPPVTTGGGSGCGTMSIEGGMAIGGVTLFCATVAYELFKRKRSIR